MAIYFMLDLHRVNEVKALDSDQIFSLVVELIADHFSQAKSKFQKLK